MNWQAWREVGMASTSKTLLLNLDESNSTDPQDGCLLFEKIINADLNQVIVSNEDLNLYQVQNKNIDSKHQEQTLLKKAPSVINSDVSGVLSELWRQTLGVSEVGLDDDFYDLGGHSLLAISLLAKIRAKFGIRIPSTTLFNTKTIRGLSTIIQSYTQENKELSPLVVLKHGDESKPPLFIVHPVGGTVFCYLSMVEALTDNRTVYAFQDPSIEYEKPLFLTIEEMATCYRNIIEKIQPAGPYYLCGASFGASVVTEIAYQLYERQEALGFVGLIDGWAKNSKTQFDLAYVKEIIHLHQQDLKVSDQSNKIDNQAIWEGLLQHRLNMMLNYSHKKMPIKLTLFKAIELLPEYQDIDAEDNHWSHYSSLPVDVFCISGDHNTILHGRNAQNLAEFIQVCIKMNKLDHEIDS